MGYDSVCGVMLVAFVVSAYIFDSGACGSNEDGW